MPYQPIEELAVFEMYEGVADWAWVQVSKWPHLAKQTIGEQLVRSIDSVNANLVEGDGRYSTADSLRFFIIARGSAREARLWLRRAAKRGLVDAGEAAIQIEKLTSATRLLNQLITYHRGHKAPTVKESRALYSSSTKSNSEIESFSDPFQGDFGE